MWSGGGAYNRKARFAAIVSTRPVVVSTVVGDCAWGSEGVCFWYRRYMRAMTGKKEKKEAKKKRKKSVPGEIRTPVARLNRFQGDPMTNMEGESVTV